MNITMVVPYFEPEITAIVHLMSDLAYDFATYGAKVTVVTGFPVRGTTEAIRNEYYDKKEEQIADNLKILRVGSKNEEGSNFLLRGLKYIAKTYAFYKKAYYVPTDVYFIYSTPPIMGLAGAFLSKKAPTVYSLQDIFPDNLLARWAIKNDSILANGLKAMESFIYRSNTHIVTLSKDMRNNLIEKRVDEDKVSIIGNWIDTNEMKYIPRESNYLFEKFNLDKNGFYVAYCGNLGFAQDIKIILESAKITHIEEPDINYVIIGNGVCEAEIKRQITNEGISNISVFPLQPEKDSAYVYSLGDIGLVTLKEGLHKYAMPSKAWSMMSVGQPVICTAVEDTELYETLYKVKAGIAVHPEDYNDLAKQIMDLYHEQNRLKTYGENGRKYAEISLKRENATKRYYDLLTLVSGNQVSL